jgi:hypothetical protein
LIEVRLRLNGWFGLPRLAIKLELGVMEGEMSRELHSILNKYLLCLLRSMSLASQSLKGKTYWRMALDYCTQLVGPVKTSPLLSISLIMETLIAMNGRPLLAKEFALMLVD